MSSKKRRPARRPERPSPPVPRQTARDVTRRRGPVPTTPRAAGTGKRPGGGPAAEPGPDASVDRPRAGRRSIEARTRLAPAQLRWTCPPVAPGRRQHRLSTLLGQDRPLAAMRTGLGLYAPGYNIFVSGTVGSGRSRLVTDLIRRSRPACRTHVDRVFVSNFQEPNRPRLLSLPRGAGPRFRDEMHELVHLLQDGLQAALRSRAHRVSHDLVLRSSEEREKRLMAALDRQARKDGLAVAQFPGAAGGMMADIYPLFEGEAVNPEAFRELVQKGRVSHAAYVRLRARRDRLMDRLEDVTTRLLRHQHETDGELRRMDQQVAGHVLKTHLRSFASRWDSAPVADFLDGLAAHVLHDLDRWVTGDPRHEADEHGELLEGDAAGVGPGSERDLDAPPVRPRPAPPAPPSRSSSAPLPRAPGQAAPPPRSGGNRGSTPAPAAATPTGRGEPVRYLGVEVHVVKTSETDECPLVVETNPTYANLFGIVEPPRDGQASLANVHPGSLLRADGGYLVLRLAEVMAEPGVWGQLKRALKVGKVEIREYDTHTGVTSGCLQPEAVPLDIKVIMIGEHGAYDTLAYEDSQFLQTFKVHAEFDTVLPATRGNMRRYADLLDWFRRSEGLHPFSSEANAAVVEYGARAAGRRDRLTARYGELADLAREASHLCGDQGQESVTRAHVEAAVAAQIYRADLPRESVERDFHDGYVLVETRGEVVGQVNALTVIESDAIAFGKPSRITVATGAGSQHRAGLVNIEREAQLSGPLHDKGVMILHGYLLQRFARVGPLNLQATICFEQTYGGVDGDSASGAELCALLSSLGDVPLRQGLGVTGAINQHGIVQAVSGVNEKVEGFFRLCRARGRGGDHGVILPRANVADLMLDPEVVQAVADGRFRIHAVDDVEEMLTLLSGLPFAEIAERVRARLALYTG